MSIILSNILVTGTTNILSSTEPHTGLPMDLSKGSGEGGTDGSRTVDGYHSTAGTSGEAAGVTDWEAIKKGNTPY